MMIKFIILMFCIVSVAHATMTNEQFSADAVITIPSEPSTISKLYVGHNVLRTEINTENGLIVDIIFPMEGKIIKLNPQVKQYVVISVKKQTNDSSLKGNPCYRLSNASCTLLGGDVLNKLITQKWQVSFLVDDKKISSLHWIDKQRGLAVKEHFSDGSMAEMKLQGEEFINKRKVEKWTRILNRADGSIVYSYQWYDPQLKISIREELPGGYIRELKNIILTKQESDLFEIPDDYKLLKPNHDLKSQSTVRNSLIINQKNYIEK